MIKNIDKIDRQIMQQLASDGRLSNKEIAEQVGLSPSPCWQRIRRLEKEGYIKGYTAIFDQEKLGFSETVIIEVTLDRHDEEISSVFDSTIAALPEVLEVHLVSGEYDYFIKVAVNGTRGYEKFLREKLYKIPGVRHSRSVFSLKCLKRSISVEL